MIKNAPELLPGLNIYYDAFLELSTCRAIGMSLGYIPWTAIKEYGEVYQFDSEQTEDLFYFVREMDQAFLKYHAKVQDGKSKSIRK